MISNQFNWNFTCGPDNGCLLLEIRSKHQKLTKNVENRGKSNKGECVAKCPKYNHVTIAVEGGGSDLWLITLKSKLLAFGRSAVTLNGH